MLLCATLYSCLSNTLSASCFLRPAPGLPLLISGRLEGEPGKCTRGHVALLVLVMLAASRAACHSWEFLGSCQQQRHACEHRCNPVERISEHHATLTISPRPPVMHPELHACLCCPDAHSCRLWHDLAPLRRRSTATMSATAGSASRCNPTRGASMATLLHGAWALWSAPACLAGAPIWLSLLCLKLPAKCGGAHAWLARSGRGPEAAHAEAALSA